MRDEDKSGDLPHQVKQTPTGLWGALNNGHGFIVQTFLLMQKLNQKKASGGCHRF